jgi:hypothetical protein
LDINELEVNIAPIIRRILGDDADFAIFATKVGDLQVASEMLGLTADQTEAAISRIKTKLDDFGNREDELWPPRH